MNNNQNSAVQPAEDSKNCCSQLSCCAPQGPVVHTQPKVARNALCPCNSGRKYKKCCG